MTTEMIYNKGLVGFWTRKGVRAINRAENCVSMAN
jgi:hypothetical protein